MRNTPREWHLLKTIRDRVLRQDTHTVVGFGDDAFVFKNYPGYSVLCQDMMVEGTHFRREATSASDLGYKSLAVNLSDIAAMGARPHYAQISLALPADITESWLDEFYQGVMALADQTECKVIGGDLTRGEQLVIDVSVHGSCTQPLTRKGVRPGDLLLVSGPLGLAHGGWLVTKEKGLEYPESQTRFHRPSPRLDLVPGLQERAEKVHALMDCSDGLVNDVFHLARQSDYLLERSAPLGCVFFSDDFWIHPETSQIAGKLEIPTEEFALWGGEDYQLLVAVAPEDRELFSEFKVIGEFNSSSAFALRKNGGVSEIKSFKGWRHF